MYEESACFDPNSNLQDEEYGQSAENGFSKANFSMEELHSYPQNQFLSSAMGIDELQKQLNLEGEHCYNMNNNNVDLHNQEMANSFNGDLLNMFPLPRSLLPNSSLTFSNSSQRSFLASLGFLGGLDSVPDGSSASASVVYDPLLNLPPQPQPPLLRELFNSMPSNGGFAGFGGMGVNNGSLFGTGVDIERENNNIHLNGGGGLVYHQDDDDDGRCNFDNGVFEFSAGGGMNFTGKNKDGKDTKTERDRRVLMSDKYQALRKLVPRPSKEILKNDRASIVADAIDYINELKREVNEAKFLVEKKRCARERLKRSKTIDNDVVLEGNGSNSLDEMDSYNCPSLRSSWLQRKSKNTEVDVRIIDDEVTVKVVQQKRIMNCLLLVSKVLDELQLDLHHVAGGLIGDYYSFLFNSKISEGSIVYASAIANKLIEVVDKQYAATTTCSN